MAPPTTSFPGWLSLTVRGVTYLGGGTASGQAAPPGGFPGGFFGPNFEYTSAAPEPSQFGMLALMGLGLGGLVLAARRRRATCR